MKSFSNETLNCFQKVLGLLHFGSCQNCMSSANLVAKNSSRWTRSEWMHNLFSSFNSQNITRLNRKRIDLGIK